MEIFDITLGVRGSNISLTNNNLTARNTTKNLSSVRATHGKFSGSWYWEVQIGGRDTVGLAIGISNTSFLVSTGDVHNNNQRSYYCSGSKFPGNISYGTRGVVNDIIGVALDVDNGTLEFYKNGTSMGISHTNVKELGEVYPLAYFGSYTTSGTVEARELTFNFGASPFNYELPHGFYSYDGSQSSLYNKILLSSNSKTYSLTPPIYATETAIPQMTSNTTPSGRAFASSIFASNYDAWTAFDDTKNYASGSGSGGVGHLGYEFVKNVAIGKYSLATNSTGYMVKGWTFEGSNDEINWTVLDKQTNQVWTTTNTSREYEIDISKIASYKMYRLNWTANNGGVNYVQFKSFKLYKVTNWGNLMSLSSQIEQTFINYGLESPINITQLDGLKSIESNSTTHESGKKFTHTIDLSKRRVDKIILS